MNMDDEIELWVVSGVSRDGMAYRQKYFSVSDAKADRDQARILGHRNIRLVKYIARPVSQESDP